MHFPPEDPAAEHADRPCAAAAVPQAPEAYCLAAERHKTVSRHRDRNAVAKRGSARLQRHGVASPPVLQRLRALICCRDSAWFNRGAREPRPGFRGREEGTPASLQMPRMTPVARPRPTGRRIHPQPASAKAKLDEMMEQVA